MLDVLDDMEGLAGMLDGAHCDCWFNKTEVENSGGRDNTDGSMAGVRMADKCIANCKDQFLDTVLPGYSNETDAESFKTVCSKLTADGPNQQLWPLYWCDTTFCGVWIDQKGQDPNVNGIINSCNNFGYSGVFDPGLPPPDYKCITDIDKLDGLGGQCRIPAAAQTAPDSANSQPPVTITSTSSVVLATQGGLSPVTTPPTTTSPTGVETTLVSFSSSNPNASATAHTNNNLPTGVKVAIAVCSSLSLLAALLLALFLLHRRRKHSHAPPSSSLPVSTKDHGHVYRPPGSPTSPLMDSPNTTRPPLTPPLRLRDRKFLPSILNRQSRSLSPPLTPLNPVHFPSSPICSPTTNRLIPRHERTPRKYGQASPPLSPPPIPPAYFADSNRGSLGSNSTVTFADSTKSVDGGQAATTSVPSLRKESLPYRPPRPHEASDIPDLVSPVSPTASVTVISPGPPPNRALPKTPLIIVDGASPCPSPEHDEGVGKRGKERKGSVSRANGREGGREMSLDLNFGARKGR